MTWTTPEEDFGTVHPDWLDAIAQRFGGGTLWRDMCDDMALRSHLVSHLLRQSFGNAPPLPEELNKEISSAMGPDALWLLRAAGWLWYAPVLLPRMIAGGRSGSLTDPDEVVLRALPTWRNNSFSVSLTPPTSDATIDAAGAACRLAWIGELEGGVAHRIQVQLPKPTVAEKAIAATKPAGRIFAAALDLHRGGASLRP